MRMEGERISKRFFNGNFIIQDQWENQEQDGRPSSQGTRHISKEYENGGDKQKTENNGGVF
jgi:hypothetical protein